MLLTCKQRIKITDESEICKLNLKEKTKVKMPNNVTKRKNQIYNSILIF